MVAFVLMVVNVLMKWILYLCFEHLNVAEAVLVEKRIFLSVAIKSKRP